jgi:hypothetical protein
MALGRGNMEMISSWDAWCAVHADLDFWRDEIRSICGAHGVPFREISATFPGTHAVFFVNSDMVLKIFCPVRHNSYGLELRLREGVLARFSFLPVVRFHGRSPSGYDYIAFSRFRGHPIRETGPSSIREEALQEIAHALIAVQSATLDRAKGGLRCLVHYDLTEDHVYLDHRGRLEGIIDWGDARMAHPSEEFPVLFVGCFRCDDSLIGSFQDAYDRSCRHYQVREQDLAGPIQTHPFRSSIVADLTRWKTTFSDRMLEMLANHRVEATRTSRAPHP